MLDKLEQQLQFPDTEKRFVEKGIDFKHKYTLSSLDIETNIDELIHKINETRINDLTDATACFQDYFSIELHHTKAETDLIILDHYRIEKKPTITEEPNQIQTKLNG